MVLAILQARFSSSRFPGKVLKKILGKPMLLHQIERLSNSNWIDKLVVATSDDTSDDMVEKMCLDNNIEVYRGELNNVLDRFYRCAKYYSPKHIVRLTGDCPLIDAEIVDNVIQYHLKMESDYTSNINPPTYPDGLDVEVMKFSALEKAHKFARLPSELEHVTPYIRNTSGLFKQYNLKYKVNLSNHRWTVDEPKDFEFVQEVYRKFRYEKNHFSMQDILDLLERNPYIQEKNYHILRNEGSLRSYKEDKIFLQGEDEV